MVAKYFLNGERLKFIVVGRARPMGVDVIDSIKICLAIVKSVFYGDFNLRSIGIGDNRVKSVTGETAPQYFSMAGSSSIFCMGSFFEDKNCATFSKNKAITTFVEGPRGLFGSIISTGKSS